MITGDLEGLSSRASAIRYLTGLILFIGVGAIVCVIAMWPTGDAPTLGAQVRNYVDARVVAVSTSTCDSIEVPGAMSGCRKVDLRITSGSRADTAATLTVLETQFEVPSLSVGDRIVVADSRTPSGADSAPVPEEFRYSFADFQRGTPMLALALLFVVVVVAFGRSKGLRALLGLVASAAVLVVFIVPALLRDSPALLVALSGTVLVAYLALYLAHGFNTGTTVALTGTLLSLGIIAALSEAAVAAAHLSGLANDEAQVLSVTAGALDLRGLLLAGIIVGALGVLDDVTVTQVSTVRALLAARPDIGRRELYAAASNVGRDHIASTINTLVLAYAGASLPLILFFAQGTNSISRNLSTEVVAVEIVRMLVGSIGLVVSVPITTALAAAILEPESPEQAAIGGHVH